MSVLIHNMKMPETCAGCEWSRYSFPNAWCSLTHKSHDADIAKRGRPDDCPIEEVVSCKDCKYAHMTTRGLCKYCDQWDYDESLYLDGDFFCGFCERKTE